MAPIKNTNTVSVATPAAPVMTEVEKLDKIAAEATAASEAAPDDKALMLVAREARLKAFQVRQAKEETVVQRAQRSVKSIGASVRAALDYLRPCAGQGNAGQQAEIAGLISSLESAAQANAGQATAIEALIKSGFVPAKETKVTRSAAVAVTVDAHVALVEAVKAEYFALGYTEEKCGDLFVEKIIGKKVLLRIGAKPSEGKTNRFFGFVGAKEITVA